MLDSSLSGIVTTLLLVFLLGVITAKPGLYAMQKVIWFFNYSCPTEGSYKQNYAQYSTYNIFIMRHINQIYRVTRSLKMQLTNLL